MNEDYIEITNEDLFKLIPVFAGFIDMGRQQYRLDLSSDDLAKEVVNWQIKQRKKDYFKLIISECEAGNE